MRNLVWILLLLTSVSCAQNRELTEVEKAVKLWEMYEDLFPEVDKLIHKMREVRTSFEPEIEEVDKADVKAWLDAYNARLERIKILDDSIVQIKPLAKTKLRVLEKWKKGRVYSGTEMIMPLRGMHPELEAIAEKLHQKYGERIAKYRSKWQPDRNAYIKKVIAEMAKINDQPNTAATNDSSLPKASLNGTIQFFCIEPL